MPEREIRPFHHPASPELAANDAIEELAGREPKEPRPGPEDADLRRPRLAQQGELALRPDQRDRDLGRAQQGHGMRVEGDRQRGHTRGVGLGPKAAQELLVTAMDPVEVADGNIGASSPCGEVTNVLDRDHQRPSP